jgi:drug/metabolite transporter (DMT)-like permease
MSILIPLLPPNLLICLIRFYDHINSKYLLYLIGSILLTSYLTLSFKVTHQRDLPNLQVLVFVSIASTLTGLSVNGSLDIPLQLINEGWLVWSIVIGCLFIGLFMLIAAATQKAGVAVASASNRLSLIIPFVFSVVYYREEASAGKIAGIGIILLAVVLICLPRKNQASSFKEARFTHIILPALIFVGSGLRDTTVKYVQQQYLGDRNQSFFLIFCFAFAAIFGLLFLVIRLATREEQFNKKSILAGIVIGIPAYFSFWCMVIFLSKYPRQSGVVIPIHNMAIVIVTTLLGLVFFKEKLSAVNWLGIGLSIAGILLVTLR